LFFEYFIAKRLLNNEVEGTKVSRPIIRISIVSIALAIVVNLITIAVVTGFQNEVREKVSGFGSHAFIMNSGEATIYESESIHKNQAFYNILKNKESVKNIQRIAYKPVLFQSEKSENTYTLSDGKDTTFIQQEISGAIIKGVDLDYDWTFFKENLVEGKLPNFNTPQPSQELLISKKIASDLKFKVGDSIRAFFVKNPPIKMFFKVSGIYSTGLEELDKKITVGDIRWVQQLNDWGIKAKLTLADTLLNHDFIIKCDAYGGNGNYRYDWGEGYENAKGFNLYPIKDTLIRVIVSDYWTNLDGRNETTSIADTAYLKIEVKGDRYSYCSFPVTNDKEIIRTYLDQSGLKYKVSCPDKTYYFTETPGKGSAHNYVGGFEVNVADWTKLKETTDDIRREVALIPNEHQEELKVSSILDNQKEIFVWLGFLDLNVIIILVLMILIGIINMGSGLLVLIIVKTNFIGLLKSMGAKDWSIRKIFLVQAAFLIGKGMFWGNLIGLTFCFIQKQFGIITLNPDVYYLDKAPIELHFWPWLLLNLGTLVVCILALIIPSYVITRISPSKAIKID
jgi:lipoprotein-releasing system permease protein